MDNIFIYIIAAIAAIHIAIFSFFYYRYDLDPIKKRMKNLSLQDKERFEKEKKQHTQRIRSSRIQRRLKDIFQNKSQFSDQYRHFFYRSGIVDNINSYGLVYLSAIFFIVFIFDFLLKDIVASIILGIIAASVGAFAVLKNFEQRWLTNFNIQFISALDIMIRSLDAGLTLQRGMAVVIKETAPPVSSEFNYILAQTHLGMPLTQALSEAANRIGVEDFRFFTAALIIQSQTGGSLSEVLRKITELIRDREKVRQKVDAITADVRINSFVLVSLPPGLLFVLTFFRSDYLKFFFHTPIGNKLLAIILCLYTIGIVLLRITTKIKF